jgi:hypothetical protein
MVHAIFFNLPVRVTAAREIVAPAPAAPSSGRAGILPQRHSFYPDALQKSARAECAR